MNINEALALLPSSGLEFQNFTNFTNFVQVQTWHKLGANLDDYLDFVVSLWSKFMTSSGLVFMSGLKKWSYTPVKI